MNLPGGDGSDVDAGAHRVHPFTKSLQSSGALFSWSRPQGYGAALYHSTIAGVWAILDRAIPVWVLRYHRMSAWLRLDLPINLVAQVDNVDDDANH